MLSALRALHCKDRGGSMTAHDRGQLLWRLADAIEAKKQVFGELDAIDNGKPLHIARDVDAIYSARHFRYFAGWPSKIEGKTIPVSSPGKMNLTKVEPVGVCGLITPWNYPTLMVAWKLAPAMAAGKYDCSKTSRANSAQRALPC